MFASPKLLHSRKTDVLVARTTDSELRHDSRKQRCCPCQRGSQNVVFYLESAVGTRKRVFTTFLSVTFNQTLTVTQKLVLAVFQPFVFDKQRQLHSFVHLLTSQCRCGIVYTTLYEQDSVCWLVLQRTRFLSSNVEQNKTQVCARWAFAEAVCRRSQVGPGIVSFE